MASPSDTLAARRAAGAVLRALRRPGAPLQRPDRSDPVRPALAIDALVAAMRARFGLNQDGADMLLRPAIADWRDAVGCADPLLVPSNAQGPSAEKALLPLPLPSWAAWLFDCRVLLPDGAPFLDGPRVVQRAFVAVVRETELEAVECFPVVFAGRFGSGAASVRLHLAISPPFSSESWRGPVLVRAAAHRSAGDQPVPIWIGPPASPGGEGGEGSRGEAVATWSTPTRPRWAVVRALEGREPQALLDVDALWQARMGDLPEAGRATAASGADVSLRLAIDIGSTSTAAVEEDTASSGALGTKLLHEARRNAAPSGFRRLAGDPATAHLYGCGEQLLAPAGQLPTALQAGSAKALARVLAGEDPPDTLWLPQAGPEAPEAGVRADRFKSPDLLLLSDWLAEVPDAEPSRASRALLDAYGALLGRTLACAHASPLVAPEGGRWALRAPRLASALAVVTYPPGPWSATSAEPFSAVFDAVAAAVCRGLRGGWAEATHQLVADPAAARAARTFAAEERHPIEAFADFGGLTLQLTVRVPRAEHRPQPFVAGSSLGYLLGGERLIDAATFAQAASRGDGDLRGEWRRVARTWRQLIANGGRLEAAQPAAEAARLAILGTVLSLLRRQLAGTLRRATPDATTLRGAGVRLYLLGEGWKLAALEVPNEQREAEAMRRIEAWLAREPMLPGVPVQLQRMDKRRLCEGALRAQAEPATQDAAVELQGVDGAAGDEVRQRWFGVPDGAAGPLTPDPTDPWWQEFAGSAAAGSLLRVEQWFTADAPFRERLAAGRIAFVPGRSLLKQWLDLSGPSLVALRVHDALARSS